MMRDYKVEYVGKVTDPLSIPHAERSGYIEKLTKFGTVFKSEVGNGCCAYYSLL